ncbi:uncharacterized protein BO87DRAFT_373097 [Aspergillus neoniger CBS 115656]|uniref:Secreted protein n=1 Tax=Aspergillus neoniger (strain CBS 115656) TaxID=1448310 RepID=A0A318YUY6_ASPNB|nr:hypothetical protein BO87DRAFT_373097 [Aspergillus neoniger CBS 115656]PYH38209.1 hypothetical protein BO87DRAFT_373097 [Aspergillus neoniger CBS 115656]
MLQWLLSCCLTSPLMTRLPPSGAFQDEVLRGVLGTPWTLGVVWLNQSQPSHVQNPPPPSLAAIIPPWLPCVGRWKAK